MYIVATVFFLTPLKSPVINYMSYDFVKCVKYKLKDLRINCDYFIWVYLVLWLFCNVWVCVCVCYGNILVLTVFCIVCTVLLYCFFYVHLFLFVLSVLV